MADPRASRHAIMFYGGFASRSGGAFMHTKSLSRGLTARGWTVDVVTLERLPLPVRYLPHIVGALLNAFAAPLGFHYKGRVTRALYKVFVKRAPTDLLIFEDIYLGWNSANPSVSILHAVWSDNLQSFDLTETAVDRLKAREVMAINALDHPIVTVSEPYRDFLEQAHFRGIGRIELDVVELGLDTKGATRRAGSPVGTRSLIYCGTLEARKNVFFMLDVFARIQAADPAASLTIVGDGPDRAALEKRAADTALNVTFLGRLPHEQVLAELPKHGIYIHTALKESFSFALLEAKLAGLTTCALASLEVPKEFIDIGFAAFDAAEWSSRILAIAGPPDLTGFPDYSIERMTDHTLALVALD